MKPRFTRTFFLAALISVCAMPALAQDVPDIDPARWTKEDVTPQARYQTLKKEAGAAYRENTSQCKSLPVAERKACVAEAKRIRQDDLARAKEEARR